MVTCDHIKIAVAIFAMKGEEFLIIKRGRGCEPNKWAIPAGSMEKGEHWNEAASRELLEETELVMTETPEFLGITTHMCPCGDQWLAIWMKAQVTGEVVQSDEVLDYFWVSRIEDVPYPRITSCWEDFQGLGIEL